MNQPKTFDGVMSLDEANDVIGAGHHKEAKNGVFKGNVPEMHFTAIRGNQTVQNTSLPINNCRLVGNAVYIPNCTLEGQSVLYTGCVLDGNAVWTPICTLEGNTVLRLCDLNGNATYIGNNTPNWVNQGYTTCVAPCNTFDVQKDTNPYSATYNVFRAGSPTEGYTYYGAISPTPGICNYTANWQSTGASRCYQCVSQIQQQDVNPCSTSYTEYRWISGGSACNYNQTWTVVFGSYTCSGCNKYYVEQQTNPCASQYGQTRQGGLAESNSTYCGGCCGQVTTANYSIPDGTYWTCSNGTTTPNTIYRNSNVCFTGNQWYLLGTTYATKPPTNTEPSVAPDWQQYASNYCSGTTLYQPQKQMNPCGVNYLGVRDQPIEYNSNTCAEVYVLSDCISGGTGFSIVYPKNSYSVGQRVTASGATFVITSVTSTGNAGSYALSNTGQTGCPQVYTIVQGCLDGQNWSIPGASYYSGNIVIDSTLNIGGNQCATVIGTETSPSYSTAGYVSSGCACD
jgi:hypothetical protein